MAEKIKFEVAMERLEEIVRRLESGAPELDEAISLYEEAVKLSKLCNAKLEAAEQKVRVLVSSPDGTVTDKAFVGTDET